MALMLYCVLANAFVCFLTEPASAADTVCNLHAGVCGSDVHRYPGAGHPAVWKPRYRHYLLLHHGRHHWLHILLLPRGQELSD